MPPRKLYFENVRVGDELATVAKATIDRVQLARYAGATNDYNPLNVDEVVAKSIGMPSVVAPPTLAFGFLGQLVTDWARGAQVKKAHARFTRMMWPGDTLICKGRVSDRWGEAGKYFVELDVWAENQKGELVARGTVLLKTFFSFEDETRFRTGQPPLVVTVPRQSILNPPPPVITTPEKEKTTPSSSHAKAVSAPSKKPKSKEPPKSKKPAKSSK
jgi:acyl dehydratase